MILIAHQIIDFLAQQPTPTPTPSGVGSIPIPDPPAKPLPGKLGERSNDILGYAKTGTGIGAFLGLLIAAAMTVIGFKGRSDVAKAALGHVPYVLIGTGVAGAAAAILQAFS